MRPPKTIRQAQKTVQCSVDYAVRYLTSCEKRGGPHALGEALMAQRACEFVRAMGDESRLSDYWYSFKVTLTTLP